MVPHSVAGCSTIYIFILLCIAHMIHLNVSRNHKFKFLYKVTDMVAKMLLPLLPIQLLIAGNFYWLHTGELERTIKWDFTEFLST